MNTPQIVECDCCTGEFPDACTITFTHGQSGPVRVCIMCLRDAVAIVEKGMKEDGFTVVDMPVTSEEETN